MSMTESDRQQRLRSIGQVSPPPLVRRPPLPPPRPSSGPTIGSRRPGVSPGSRVSTVSTGRQESVAATRARFTGGPGASPATASVPPAVASPLSTASTSPLSPKEMEKLRKYKTGRLHQLVKKIKVLPPTAPAEQQGKWDEFQEFMGGSVVAPAYEHSTEDIGAAFEMAGNITEFKENAPPANTVKLDGNAFGVFNAVIGAFNAVIKTVTVIKEISAQVKANQSEVTAGERISLFLRSIDTITDCLKAATSIIGVFSTLASKIPLIGAILGAISSGLSFVFNLKDAIKSIKSRGKMGAQREKAMAAIAAKDTGHRFVEQVGTGDKRHSQFREDLSAEGDKADSFLAGRRRSKRLDDVTEDMRTPPSGGIALTGMTAPNMRAELEDYDMVAELYSANKKRRDRAIADIICKDMVNFASSLASLDPTGVGSVVGAALSAASALGYTARTVVTSVRQHGRDKGWRGYNVNKSTGNKEERRSRLANNLFQRIVSLQTPDIDTLDPDTAGREMEKRAVLGNYHALDQRVNALGIGYGPLLRSGSHADLKAKMTKGFYREHD